MAATTETETVWLPLESIALSTAPNRQIREVRERDVLDLMETDHTTWDPILVRPWPAGEPYPLGEEGRAYQVVAGYHRASAARRMTMPQGIKAIVRNDLTDDRAFLLVALASNLRHGAKMERADIIAQVKRMRDEFSMSIGEIAKSLSLPKGTVQTWLSGRDTNAARLARNASSDRRDGQERDGNVLAKAWRVPATPHLSEVRQRELQSAISKALVTSHDLTPADILALAGLLQPGVRRVLAKHCEELAIFWGSAAAAFGDNARRERDADHDDEAV